MRTELNVKVVSSLRFDTLGSGEQPGASLAGDRLVRMGDYARKLKLVPSNWASDVDVSFTVVLVDPAICARESVEASVMLVGCCQHHPTMNSG
jgi:hypothetical protein